MTSVDYETTGFEAGYHEIIEMAFVPLDSDLDPVERGHFYTRVNPLYPERADPKAMETNGISLEELKKWPNLEKVTSMWEEWFRKMNLPLGKKLCPLAQNWSMENKFTEDWMGIPMMRKRFTLARDPLRAAAYENDKACFQCRQLPFSTMTLKALCEHFGIPLLHEHNALHDAIATARVYKELLRM